MGRIIPVVLVLLLGLGPLGQGLDVPGPGRAAEDTEPVLFFGGPEAGPDATALLSNIDGRFTENLGQYGEGAGRYYCMGNPLSVAIGPGWVSYHHNTEGAEQGIMVRIDFEGAYQIDPTGSRPLSYPTNFLIGNDPDGWVVGARSFEEVSFKDLYDGIDLVYRFEEGMLKYDLFVEPFADISQVRFRYSGQDVLSIDEGTGDLVIGTPLVDLVDKAPVSFQGEPGSGNDISSRYLLLDEDTVSFEVNGYDPRQPLVIDPGLVFSTFIGGRWMEYANLKLDEEGNVYLGGQTGSPGFPTTPGVVSETYLSNVDGFVCKLKADGSDLLFSTYIGTIDHDVISDIELDTDKNIIVTGFTNSSDFLVTNGSFQKDPGGKYDAFVMKINSNCTSIIWCTLLGGSDSDHASNMDIMSTGDAVIMGETNSIDFPMTVGSNDDSLDGKADVFVARVSQDGTQLIGSTYIGGSENESSQLGGLVVGPDDTVYLALSTDSDDIPTSQGAVMPQFNGGLSDVAVVKMDANLTRRVYSTYLGGADIDSPKGITVDDMGCLYLNGLTKSDDFPTTEGAWNRTFTRAGMFDGFLTKLSPDGSSLEFSTYFGGIGDDVGGDIDLGDNGLVFFTVATKGLMLPTTEHSFQRRLMGCHDIYLGVLDGENQTLRYGTYLGGIGCEGLRTHLEVDGSNVTLVTDTESWNYPTTPGAYDTVISGINDIAVTRLNVVLSDPVIPDPPTNLTARLDNLSVELDWDPPVSNGGFNLWYYRVYRGTSRGNLSLVSKVDPIETLFNDTLPSPGQPYYYAVKAHSPAGKSRFSNIVEVTQPTLPGPPSDLIATPGCGTIQLNWSTPTYTGGLPILGYHVYRRTDTVDMVRIDSIENETGYFDQGLVNGKRYFYKISAENDEGIGDFTLVVSALPTGPPTAPRDFKVKIGDGRVTLIWVRPESNGGKALTGYRVLRGTNTDLLEPLTNLSWSDNAYIDDSVQNGVTYYYAVLAINLRGDGPLSRIIDATPSSLPGMPLAFRVLVRIGQVELTWKPPDEDGGMPIKRYTVYRGTSEGSLDRFKVTDGPVTAFVDTDLEYGKTVYYAVSAFNIMGDGPQTEAIEVWPVTLPDPPRGVTAKAGKDVVTVSWLHPLQDGGSEVRRFVVYRGTSLDTMEPLTTLDASELSHLDTDVVGRTVYYYAVTTVTDVGEGSASGAVSAKPFTLPSVPMSLVYILQDGALELQWIPPEDNGGRPILSYRVYRGMDPGSMVLLTEVADAFDYIDTSATPTLSYFYAISAINEAGEGPISDAIEAGPAVPLVPPGPVRNLRERVDGDTVRLSWEPPSYDGGSPVIGYVIFRGPAPDDLREIVRVYERVTYDDRGREVGRTYHYAVCAFNKDGMGELSEVIQVHVIEDDGILSWGSLVLWLMASVVILGVVAGSALVSEPFRFSLALLALPLFTRFKRGQVLDNKNRYSIHGLIMDKPGIHYSEIIREFELTNGVAAYHLNILEREDFIHSMREGRLKRFYSKYTKVPKDHEMTPEETRKRILDYVTSRPGISQKDIIDALGISRDSAGYFLREMVKEGMLEGSRKGKYTIYHPQK